jgi:serine O-acetyltransferase
MDGLADAEPRGDKELPASGLVREVGNPDPNTYFFIHLMKTAGTSFAFQLRKHFDASEIYPSEGLDRRDGLDMASYVSVSRLLRTAPERRDAIRVYTGHFPYVVSDLLERDLVRITILRDPVDRTLSVLKHFKRLARRYRSYPLEAIYEDPFIYGHFIENHQARMFSVTRDDKPEAFGSVMSYWATAALLGFGKDPDSEVTQDEIDREIAVAPAMASMVDERRFEIAKENLANVDVVGISERYGEFIDELRSRYGWWPNGLNTNSRANVSSEGWDAPAALRKRIAADNAFDVELYNFGLELVRRRGGATSRTNGSTAAGASVAASTPEDTSATARHHEGSRKRSRKESAKGDGAARTFMLQRRAQHPKFLHALIADAKITASFRAERSEFRGNADAIAQALRLMWVSDAFLAQALYRAKARMQALRVPVLPRLAHKLAMATAQVCIGDPVVIRPGIYLAHGQVVIDGLVDIERGVVVFPWVTIGLRAGDVRGPKIGRNVHVGTGAKIIGPVTVHDGARIGANAVVVDDVPAKTSVVGVKARPVNTSSA